MPLRAWATSVASAELVFPQLSRGQSTPPWTTVVFAPCVSKRHLACKHTLVPGCRAPPHPAATPGPQLSGRLAGCTITSNSLLFFQHCALVPGSSLCCSPGLAVTVVPGSLRQIQRWIPFCLLLPVEVVLRSSSCSGAAVSVLSKPQHVFRSERGCERKASRDLTALLGPGRLPAAHRYPEPVQMEWYFYVKSGWS